MVTNVCLNISPSEEIETTTLITETAIVSTIKVHQVNDINKHSKLLHTVIACVFY